MECTQKILVAFAIFGFLSISSAAYIKRDFDFAKNTNFELPRNVREKRETEHLDFSLEDNTVSLEDRSEFEKLHDRRAIVDEIQEASSKHEEQEKHSNTEETTQDETILSKHTKEADHTLAHSDKDLTEENLQEVSTDSANKVLKRHLVYDRNVEYPVATRKILGASFLEEIPLERLDGHSCETEAREFGHAHHSGLLVHQLCCELRKFVHYMRIAARNCKSEFTLGPLVTEEKIEDDVLGAFYRHTPQLLEAVIKEPHHLLILPEIIRDAVPFPSICEALHRIRIAFFKVLHFGCNLIKVFLHHLLEHFLLHHNLGMHLLRALHQFGKAHILDFFGVVLPAAEELLTEKILPVTEDCEDELYVPEYKQSFDEVVASIRGLHDGYYGSGIHDLLKSGVRTISSSTSTSTIASYLSTIPFVDSVAPYLDGNFVDVSPVEVRPAVTPIFEKFAPVVDYLRPLFSPLAPGPVITPIESVAPVEAKTVSTSVSSTSSIVDVVKPVDIAYPVEDCEPVLNEVAVPVREEAVSAVATSSVSAVDVDSLLVNPGVATETVTSTSAASALSSVNAPVVSGPVVTPLLGYNYPVTSYGSFVNPITSFYPASAGNLNAAAAVSTAGQLVNPVISPVLGNPVINPFVGYNTLVNPVYSAPQAISSLANAASTATVVETEPVIAASPVVPEIVGSLSETSVSESSASVSVVESAPVETIPEVVDCGPSPVVASDAVESTVTTTATTSTSVSADVAAVPVSSGPLGLVSAYRPRFAPAAIPVENTVTATAAASASADVATLPVSNGPLGLVSGYRPGLASAVATSAVSNDQLVESLPFPRYGPSYPEYPLYPVQPELYSPSVPSVALASAMGVTDLSRTSTVLSRREFSFALPRQKVITALGSDCVAPGDIVSVTLRNKAVLYGSVLDAESPIRFSFARPRFYGGLLRNGARVWNVLHSDFADPECTEIFNDPVLLSY